jgi:hypothetical protein
VTVIVLKATTVDRLIGRATSSAMRKVERFARWQTVAHAHCSCSIREDARGTIREDSFY